MSKVIIIGSGAQAKYAAETFRLSGVAVAGVVLLEGNGAPNWLETCDLKPLPMEPDFAGARESGGETFVVCSADAQIKHDLFHQAVGVGLEPLNAIHPAATVASTANIGRGVIINAGAVVQPFATIGDGVMVHGGAIIEHDVNLGAFSNIAPGASLAGWVKVDAGATVLAGATVIPSVEIGEGAIVAAGACVTEDVDAWTMVAGVPAKLKKRIEHEEVSWS